MKAKSMLWSLALAALTATAHAEIRAFTFTGTVTESLPMALAGSRLTGTFSYDIESVPYLQTGDPAGPGSGDASYLAKGNLAMTVNGHSLTAATTVIYVVNNFGGNVEDAVSVFGETMTLDGTLFPEGTFGFYVGSGPGKRDVLRGTALPQTIPVERYDAANFGWVLVDAGANGTVLTFRIDRVVPRTTAAIDTE